MRYSEWLALGFFVWLVAGSARPGLRPPRRWQVAVLGSVMGAAVVLIAGRAPTLVRDWAPAIYILVGYYLSGRLFSIPSTALERWLAEWDDRLLVDPPGRFREWPRWLVAYLDIIYMFCFVLVPGGFAVLAWMGQDALADRYWTMVVASEFGSFAPLALVQTRPPWALERAPELTSRGVHRVVSMFVKHGTIGANTFPSGHVAGSLAVALAVTGVAPFAGAVFFVLAVSIAVGCVVGRYHYVIDVAAGAAVALVVWAAVGALGI